jgi:hypothetical protein
MAGILYISEFPSNMTPPGNAQIGCEPSTDQTVAMSATSAQSTTLQNNTQLVRVHSDTTSANAIKFGVNPTAVVTNKRLAANATEYFTVPLSSGWKIAGINVT